MVRQAPRLGEELSLSILQQTFLSQAFQEFAGRVFGITEVPERIVFAALPHAPEHAGVDSLDGIRFMFARNRSDAEAIEGLSAFLEKRPADWVPEK